MSEIRDTFTLAYIYIYIISSFDVNPSEISIIKILNEIIISNLETKKKMEKDGKKMFKTISNIF